MPFAFPPAPAVLRPTCLRTVTAAISALMALSLLLGLAPHSATAQTAYEQQVQQMYIAYYGRPGDPAGVDYWTSRLADAKGMWTTDLVNAFGTSPEYLDRFGTLSRRELINHIFIRLFNRTVDPVGHDYYIDLLAGSNISGLNPGLVQSSLAEIALDISNGAQHEDRSTLANKVAVAQNFTSSIRQNDGFIYGRQAIQEAEAIISNVDETADSIESAQEIVQSLAIWENTYSHRNECPDQSNQDCTWEFFKCECTSYVADKINETGFLDEEFDNQYSPIEEIDARWSNARNWRSEAAELGINCDENPRHGSVAFWSYGHVAFVEAVNGDTVSLSEYNYDPPYEHTFSRRTVKPSDSDYPDCFIQIMPRRAMVPETGQTQCFNEQDQLLDSCDSTGQDGEFITGVAWSSSDRFVDNGDGTITDSLTGLMWLTDANCPNTIGYDPNGSGDGDLGWLNALAFARDINTQIIDISACAHYAATYDDWHLPNINELESLVNYGEASPAEWLEDQGFFGFKEKLYWSSTSLQEYWDHNRNSSALTIDFATGQFSRNLKAFSSRTRPTYTLLVRVASAAAGTQIQKTGQTTCYAENGDLVACYNTGQDGDVRAGKAMPNQRFNDNGDGTITDELTGLMWIKNSCVTGHNESWQEKLNRITQMNREEEIENYGFTDWRLPNVREMRSLYSYENGRPALVLGNPFHGICLFSWSSTTMLTHPERAWMVGGRVSSNHKDNGGAPGFPVRTARH